MPKICLPVHSCFGLRIAGGGMMPSQSGTHRRMFWMKSRSMKQSRSVNLRTPQSVSWTIPLCSHGVSNPGHTAPEHEQRT